MKNILLILSLLVSIQNFAQCTLKGQIIYKKTGESIEYANIALYQCDSLFVAGTSTNERGEFQVTGLKEREEYILKISHISFYPTLLRISCFKKNTDLGKITLTEKNQILDEASAQAANIRQLDRMWIYPSTQDLKFSGNGIDLLLNLKLPHLWVDPVKNCVETNGNGEVGFLINSKPAELREIRARNPKEVLRVEYIDRPGLRYKNYAIVINYVTKIKENGGLLHAETSHTLFTYGDEVLVAKFNHKQAEIGLNYNFTFLDIDFKYYKNEQYSFENKQIIKRMWQSDKQKYLYKNHHSRLYYAHQNKNKHYFNAGLKIDYFRQPKDDMIAFLTHWDSTATIEKRIKKRQNYLTPSFEIYYERNLPNKQLLAFNLVGTYTTNDSEDKFLDLQEENILSQGGTEQEGNKWSWIGEGYYEKKSEKFNVSAGIKDFWSRIDNHFYTPEENRTLIKNNFAEIWLELSKLSEKWQNQISIGGYAQYFNENGQSHWDWKYKLLLNLNYLVNETSSFNLISGFDKESPTLTESNTAMQQNDFWLWTCGNKNLKSWTIGRAKLTYEINKKHATFYFSGSYYHHFKPAMDEVFRQPDKFIQTYNNQKSMQDIIFNAIGYFNLWDDYITLQINPMFRHHISKGNHYTHRLTSWSYTGSLLGCYKNWQIVFQIRDQFKTLFGEHIQLAQITDELIINYRHKQWLFSLGINEFLGRNYKCNEYKQLSEYYSFHEYTTAPNCQVSFKLSYTLPFGRKMESKNQRLNNQDNGDGILQ